MTLTQYILPVSFGIITSATVFTLLGFTIHNHNQCLRFDEYGYCEEDQQDEDEDRRRDDPEAAQARKLAFAMIWIMLSALSLAAMGFFTWWKKTGTAFRIGILGGSTVMMVNMAIASTLYFWSFAQAEEDEDYNYNGNNRRLPEDDNEVILQSEHTFAIVCIYVAAIYAVLSIFVLRSHDKEADTAEEEGQEEEKDIMIKGKAYVDILSDVWNGISIISLVPLIVILFVAFVPLADEDEGERVREEGYIWNLIYLSFWMVAVVIGTILFGRHILGGKGSQVLLGVFTGGLLFFAASEFLLAALYGSFQVRADVLFWSVHTECIVYYLTCKNLTLLLLLKTNKFRATKAAARNAIH